MPRVVSRTHESLSTDGSVEVDKWPATVANSDQLITIRRSPWRRPARVPGDEPTTQRSRVCLAAAVFFLGGGYRTYVTR
jgi:hypothetical protein